MERQRWSKYLYGRRRKPGRSQRDGERWGTPLGRMASEKGGGGGGSGGLAARAHTPPPQTQRDQEELFDRLTAPGGCRTRGPDSASTSRKIRRSSTRSFAIHRAMRIPSERQEAGVNYTIFPDSAAASDDGPCRRRPGPSQSHYRARGATDRKRAPHYHPVDSRTQGRPMRRERPSRTTTRWTRTTCERKAWPASHEKRPWPEPNAPGSGFGSSRW